MAHDALLCMNDGGTYVCAAARASIFDARAEAQTNRPQPRKLQKLPPQTVMQGRRAAVDSSCTVHVSRSLKWLTQLPNFMSYHPLYWKHKHGFQAVDTAVLLEALCSVMCVWVAEIEMTAQLSIIESWTAIFAFKLLMGTLCEPRARPSGGLRMFERRWRAAPENFESWASIFIPTAPGLQDDRGERDEQTLCCNGFPCCRSSAGLRRFTNVSTVL